MNQKAITLVLVACLLVFTGTVWGDTVVESMRFSGSVSHSGAYGDWESDSGRLYQKDTKEPLAKINFRVPQSGVMEYRFDVRYEGGGYEDRMGGFGVQLCVDEAFRGESWGNGESYLFWLNYDENPTYGKAGFQAQVYKSRSHVDMEIIDGYQIGLPTSQLRAANADVVVPVRMEVNCNTGLVKVWDPTRSGVYLRFYLDEAPGRGNYLSFRTNSLSVSFDNLVVTKMSN